MSIKLINNNLDDWVLIDDCCNEIKKDLVEIENDLNEMENNLNELFPIERAFHVATEEIEEINQMLKFPEEKNNFFKNILSYIIPQKINYLEEEKRFEISKLPAFFAAVAKTSFEERKDNVYQIINKNIQRFIISLAYKCEQDETLKKIFREFLNKLSNIPYIRNDVDFLNEDLNKKIFDAFANCLYREATFEQREIEDNLAPLLQKDNKNAKKAFKRDAKRQNGGISFGTIDIEDSRLICNSKEIKKNNWKKELGLYDEKLEEFLKGKIDEKNIQKFQDKIYHLFSQTAQNLIYGLLDKDLNSDPNSKIMFMPDLNVEIFNKNFDRTIEIINSETLKLQIKSKNPHQLIDLKQVHILGGPMDAIAGKIKNVKANITLHLENDEWKISKESNFVYEIEPQK